MPHRFRSLISPFDRSGLPARTSGVGVGFQPRLGLVQAASHEPRGEGMRGDRELFVSELPGQDPRRLGQIRLARARPEPGHPEEHPPIKL